MNNSKAARRQLRVMIVTAVLIVGIGAVIISAGVTQNRRGRNPAETDPLPGITESIPHSDTHKTPVQTSRIEETTAPQKEETEAAETAEKAEPASVSDPLPSFIAPVSGQGMKAHSVDVPVYSMTMEDYRTHTGVDIAAPLGEAVRAAAAGTVQEIWEDPMMGSCLSLSHTGGAVSVYKNLAPQFAEGIVPGTVVKAGDVIGAVGESALAEIAEESHVHYELHIDGAAVDPADFMLIGTTDIAFEG